MLYSKVTLSKLIVVCLTLVLSGAAGLAIARAETTAIYLPLMMSNRNKIGIAPGGYQYGDFALTRPSWTYRWNNEVYSETQQLGIEQVDMLWNERYFYMPIRSNTILGFNEPDLPGQANMTPLEGAIGWRWIETAYPTKTLVSPAPSQLHPDWLWQMVSEYEALYGMRPRFDAIAWHIYPDSFEMFKAYLEAQHQAMLAHGYNVAMWVTEFGYCGDPAFMTQAIQYIKATPWIDKAAWYKIAVDQLDTGACNTLLNSDRTLTPLGNAYIEARP